MLAIIVTLLLRLGIAPIQSVEKAVTIAVPTSPLRKELPSWLLQAGTVTIANATDSWGGSYGYHVKLDHGNGMETLYAHCSSICVTVGQQVQAGTGGRPYVGLRASKSYFPLQGVLNGVGVVRSLFLTMMSVDPYQPVLINAVGNIEYKCLGMLEAVGEVFPEAKYQRCTVHFYRNVFAVTPRSKAKLVAKMLKAIHAQESKKAAREKAKAVVEELRSMKLKEAAKKVEDGIEETLTYCDFPSEHWTRIRTNNVIERLNRGQTDQF